ncbi:MAG: DUF3524 domain-containing protein [Caldilineaceae bacterium]|nr:DUF3524 domain-containing protein [Caldilineaceae bacterium]
MTSSVPSQPLKVWLLSPYHTGSHRAWAEGYQAHSRHSVQLFTLAGRFWKWRMQGGAIELASQTNADELDPPPDLVLATDMTNLSAWLALVRAKLPARTRTVLYMHENQLTYPWRPGEKPDLTYAMINWLSQLCADLVLFNSEFHRRSWFTELPNLLKHFPDYNHLDLIEEVESRARVIPVGIDFQEENRRRAGTWTPLVLWNQRWEYDKRPDLFFNLLYRLEETGRQFKLAVAGENFRNVPAEFDEAASRLAHRIEHWGFLPSREAYLELLKKSDLVISTAEHEFFGISILEAVQAGAFPLLPNRLSYPELIPAELHAACIYSDEEELFAMACRRLDMPRPAPPSLRRAVRDAYTWPVVSRAYDNLFDMLTGIPVSDER